ncbi:MAG: hypothetical protein Q8L59_16835 [Phenylobacterium sp.]|uniref:hypothetical protein n=1 Tax=Phenylobacterium sp. TaxID=1871053 RepID=UPI00273709BD|nr:hypothetical protein [Phenylobacterium sp.]MDP1643840.1 hypothetical protein [Phenylobacterium sp.]MDP3118722.1 hypothetical protein [Phenylobacterium sp.]MDP3384816.1 hypothetical protein [Phenylobacterium sp.]
METLESNTAAVSLRVRDARFVAKVKVTPAGLLAIGGLVSGILLSTSVLVWTATNVARRRPLTAALLAKG